MEQLRNDIKNQEFKQFYLLYGVEDYLIRQYKNNLKQALINDGDTMNYSYFEGKSIQPQTVIDLAETLPFFTDHRVIFIENSGWFKKSCDSINNYVSEAPDTVIIVFVESEVDKRSRLFKLIQKLGRTVECKAQTESTITKWILGILKRENKSITKQTLDLFLSRTGLDMDIIYTELEKLLCYCMNYDQISEEDVLQLTNANTPDQIFKMMDAISNKQPKAAIEYYYDLLTKKEPPLRILALMVRQFHILLKVRLLSDEGFSGQAIAQQTGIPTFVLRKAVQQVKSFTADALMGMLEEAAQTEQAIKTGVMTDKIGVELLIVEACS